MAGRGGDPISNQARVTYAKLEGTRKIVKATIGGKDVDANATYNIATIDYLANGGDYMVSMTTCPRLYEDNENFGDRMLDYLKKSASKGKKINPSKETRMKRTDNGK